MPLVHAARFVGRFETEAWWVPGAGDKHAWRVRDRVTRRIVAWGTSTTETGARAEAELVAARFAGQRRRIGQP